MVKHLGLGLVAAAMGVSACATPAPQGRDAAPPPRDCAAVETLAQAPHGAFFENLIVEPSGRILVTSYLAREILAVDPRGGATVFARALAHPVSILARDAGGYIVAAHGAAFTAGPAFLTSNQFLVLDANGAVERVIPAPEARFLNGMTALADGAILVADSVLGRIWRLDPESGRLMVWLDAPELKPDATGADQRPGANGLKRVGDRLFVSNSFTGKIYAIGINDVGAPMGRLEEAASPGRADDFVVDAEGSFIVATHADTIVRATADGPTKTILPQGGDGATAVAFADARRSALYVLTTGGLLEGGDRPARVLRVSLPGGETICAA